MKMNAIPNWQIGEMCGRMVAYRAIKETDDTYRGVDLTKCPDCGQPATMIIQEFAENIKDTPQQPLVWGYCGVCEIGG